MSEFTPMTNHMKMFNTLFSELTSLVCKIEPNKRVELLLQNLLDSYDKLIINLTNNVLTNYLKFDDI